MLKGKSTRLAVPFIPEMERDVENPTIFWLYPKNMKGTYKSLERFSRANSGNRGSRTLNPVKMVEADQDDFVSFCEKVENYQFSEEISELSKRGMATFTEKSELKLIVEDIDPQVFQEVQNATANWDLLEKGKEAYESYTSRLKK
jgi:hypothetical protein